MQKWRGDVLFLVENLVLKDFRIRYRNMSLGILWSMINPLVMMGVLTFVFGRVFANPNSPTFPLFVLCGLIPFNFFAGALSSGTTSIVESAHLIKRLPVPREIVPVASVLSNCVHLTIQLVLLVAIALFYKLPPAHPWLWLPVLWLLFIAFVCGLALGASAINVFIRDTRYVVESFNLVLFWLVPIFYSFTIIPAKYVTIYRFNPVAALVLATRDIMIDRHSPPPSIMINMAIAASISIAMGLLIFSRLKRRFYEHI
ncbi:MAG: ABC transporter permease [Bryobacterales bacterium]|nr:ABC transporter permease [Bryobacterales bacterium]MBV9401612.1 ABC transporter permease [Bryobacterales bacterium]